MYCAYSSLSGLPASLQTGVRYNPFTAADEKIALSVVRVNNKPQYIVFYCRFRNLFSKQRHLPVESSKQPCAARASRLKFAPIPVQHPCWPVPCRRMLKPSPHLTPKQDTRTVQIAGLPVRIVEIRVHFRRTVRKGDDSQERSVLSGLEMSLFRNHLLMQNADYADSARL
jgi:hypothetical protein